jgi:hypothetical protein
MLTLYRPENMLRTVQVTARLWQVGAGAIDCTLDIVANIKMSVSRMMTAASAEDALILMPLQLPKNSVSANSDILALDVLKCPLCERQS